MSEKKTRKKSSRKRTRKTAADAPAAESSAAPEAAQSDIAGKSEPAAKKTRRKSTRKSSARKKAAGGAAKTAKTRRKKSGGSARKQTAASKHRHSIPDEIAIAESPEDKRPTPKLRSAQAEVAADSDAIVIRFPPAGGRHPVVQSQPQAPVPRSERPAPPAAPPPMDVEDEDDQDEPESHIPDWDEDDSEVSVLEDDRQSVEDDQEDEDDDDMRPNRLRRLPEVDEEDELVDAAAAAVEEEDEDDDEDYAQPSAARGAGQSARDEGADAENDDRLTPTQKRRLRRKRQAQRRRKETTEDKSESPATEPKKAPAKSETAEKPAPARDKRPQPKEEDRGRRGRRRGRRDRERDEGRGKQRERRPESESAAGSRKRREMIINVVPREECRIAVLENGRLEEIYIERASSENHVGNIYKGVVTNVEPSIQAAFIDFGLGKNGFLHISDLHPQYFPDGEGTTENVGRKMPRRSRPPIQRCLRRGQEVLVQITKEGIGTKGPTLSTYLSIPGRFLVMMPGMRKLGVSRKLEDLDARAKLRSKLDDLDLPRDKGFIARTAAVDRSLDEVQSDLDYLTRLWKAVEKRIKHDRAPSELYRESDLLIRTIRDVFSDDITRILVDDEEIASRAREFLNVFSPDSGDLVEVYNGPEPIFHRYGIEAELERLHSRHVPLKSGGSLVIDQTEALVAIDVNSGKFRTEDDAETTAFKLNSEAADEIPRQLRLRDLGGVIVCDFIDMRLDKHRREIERRLIDNLKEHKERAKVLRTSQFGMIEMTRQRQRASFTRNIYQDCAHCRGTGLVKTTESVALDAMRLIQLAVTRENVKTIEVNVSPEVSFLLQNRKRAMLHEFENRHERSISIRPDQTLGLDQLQISCYDQRGRLVSHQ